jgi:hypothetical protein
VRGLSKAKEEGEERATGARAQSMCAITEAVVATDMRRRRIQVRSRPPSPVCTVRVRARSTLACLCCVPAHTAQQFARACAERARGVATRNACRGSSPRPEQDRAGSITVRRRRAPRPPTIHLLCFLGDPDQQHKHRHCSTYCDGLGLRGGAQGRLIFYIGRTSEPEGNG